VTDVAISGNVSQPVGYGRDLIFDFKSVIRVTEAKEKT
jgi:hypothetical protein